tara:strand:+ start:43 stop:471 length:429 start_codon:yes stop_codon:yes gene_type:complete
MSSQNPISPNALQFTNDNKRAYYYTGMIPGAGTGNIKTFGSFTTTSEYIDGTVQNLGPIDNTTADRGARGKLFVKFNDELIMLLINDFDTGNMSQSAVADIIIPPFTKVELQFYDSADSTYSFGASIIGKVGMPQRVGNLDE